MAQQSTQQSVQQSEVVRRVSLPAHLRIICRGRREDENGGWDVYGTSPSGQALDPIEGLSFEEIDEILLGNFVPFLGDHGELVEIDGRRYGFRIFTRTTPRGATFGEMELDGSVEKTDPQTGEVTRWYVTLTDRAVKAWLAKRDEMPAAPRRVVEATGTSVLDVLTGKKVAVAAEETPKF